MPVSGAFPIAKRFLALKNLVSLTSRTLDEVAKSERCIDTFSLVPYDEVQQGKENGMSKGKKIGIIVSCVIAIAVIVVAVRYLPTLTREDSQVPEHVAISAYNFTEQLFDPELTSLQRDEFWDEYEGKQVKWISELEESIVGEEEITVYFLNPFERTWIMVKAGFDVSQKSSLAQLNQGDLAIYTGVLAEFGEREISLTDCTFLSLAMVPFWWNGDIDTSGKRLLIGDEALYLGPSTYKDATEHNLPRIGAFDRETGELLWEGNETETVLMGIDSHYIYTGWLTMSSLGGGVRVFPYAEAVDKLSGQVVWTSSLSNMSLSISGCQDILEEIFDWEATFAECIDVWVMLSVEEEITSKAESSLMLLPYMPLLYEVVCEYEGVIYKNVCPVYSGTGAECSGLQAIEQETGSVLWIMSFQKTNMKDFWITDGMLYASTDNGVGAFELPNVRDPRNPNSSETRI